jgi:hypothetical protein
MSDRDIAALALTVSAATAAAGFPAAANTKYAASTGIAILLMFKCFLFIVRTSAEPFCRLPAVVSADKDTVTFLGLSVKRVRYFHLEKAEQLKTPPCARQGQIRVTGFAFRDFSKNKKPRKH